MNEQQFCHVNENMITKCAFLVLLAALILKSNMSYMFSIMLFMHSFRMCARAVLRFLFYFPMINGWVRPRPHTFQFNSIERTEWEEFRNNFICSHWSTLCVHPINCPTFHSISDRKIVLLQWNGDFTEWNSIRCDTMQPVEITNSHRTKLSRRSIIITCSIYIHLKNGTWSEATNNMSN